MNGPGSVMDRSTWDSDATFMMTSMSPIIAAVMESMGAVIEHDRGHAPQPVGHAVHGGGQPRRILRRNVTGHTMSASVLTSRWRSRWLLTNPAAPVSRILMPRIVSLDSRPAFRRFQSGCGYLPSG
jgi:hypothetical protein